MAQHYMMVVTPGPLIIVRIPWPSPRWREVLKELTKVMHARGCKRKEIMVIEGLTAAPGGEKLSIEDKTFLKRLKAAFKGDVDKVSRFWLYDWKDGKFELMREGKRI